MREWVSVRYGAWKSNTTMRKHDECIECLGAGTRSPSLFSPLRPLPPFRPPSPSPHRRPRQMNEQADTISNYAMSKYAHSTNHPHTNQAPIQAPIPPVDSPSMCMKSNFATFL